MFLVDYVCINCILNLFSTALVLKKKQMNEGQNNIWQQEETLIGEERKFDI